MKYYALQLKDKFQFVCVATTKDSFNNKVIKAYWNASNMESRGEYFTEEAFLNRYNKVEIVIKVFK